MCTFYISLLFFFGRVQNLRKKAAAQHIHAAVFKKESENLTHTLYYFNFLLLLFISHFTKSTLLSCFFSSFQFSHTPSVRLEVRKVNERWVDGGKKAKGKFLHPLIFFCARFFRDKTHKQRHQQTVLLRDFSFLNITSK